MNETHYISYSINRKSIVLVDSFRDYLQSQKRYSPQTSIAYCTDLLQFNLYLSDQFNVDKEVEVTAPMIRSWLVSLSDNQTNPTTLKRKLASLRAYYKYLLRKGVISVNPAKEISTPKIPIRLPKFLNTTSVEMLFEGEGLFSATFEGLRDRLLLEFLYTTGVRRQELIDLNWSSCDFSKMQFKIRGKGNKERMLPLGGKLYELLVEYKQEVLKRFNTLPNSILLTDIGNTMYPEFVYRKVNHYLQQVTSIEKKSPHVLRHSFATHLSNNGAALNDIKELMGHSSLASTQVYTHSSIEELKKVYKQAHPMS